MGSLCSSPTTVNQSQTYRPNPYAANAITGALSQAQGVAQTPFHTPVAPVAGFSNDQMHAFQTTNAAQGWAQPYINSAQDYFAGNHTNDFLNPYAANVMAGMKDVFGQQQSDTTGKLTQQAGGVGADRIAVGQANLAKEQGLAAGQTLSGLYSPAVQAAQNAGFGIGALGPAAQNSVFQGVQAQLGTGGLQQQLQQAQMNAPYQNQLAAIQWPYQNAQFGANITGALAPGLGGTTAGNTQYPPQSPWGTVAGLGMVGAGAYGAYNQGQQQQQQQEPQQAARGGRINPYAFGGRVGYQSGGGADIQEAEIAQLGRNAEALPDFSNLSGMSAAPIDISRQSLIPNTQMQAIHAPSPMTQSHAPSPNSSPGALGMAKDAASMFGAGKGVYSLFGGSKNAAAAPVEGEAAPLGGMSEADALAAGNEGALGTGGGFMDSLGAAGSGALDSLGAAGSGAMEGLGSLGAGAAEAGSGFLSTIAEALPFLLLKRGGRVNPYANGGAVHGYEEGGAAKGSEESGTSSYYDKFVKALHGISQAMTTGPQTGSIMGDMPAGLALAMTALRPSGVRLTPTSRPDPRLQLRGRFTRIQDHGAYMQHPAVGKWPFVASGQIAANAYAHDPEDAAPSIEHENPLRHNDAPPAAGPQASNPFADRWGEMAPPQEGPRSDPLFLQSGMQPHQESDFAYGHPAQHDVPMPRPNPFVSRAEEPRRRSASAVPLADEYRAPPYRALHMEAGGVADRGETPEPAWPFLEGVGSDTPDASPSVPEYARRGPFRSMASGRNVADWRARNPEADVQETKDKWADIYNDPAGTFESVAIPATQVIGAALRNASPNAAQAQPAGGKKAAKSESAQDSESVMALQRKLRDAGFYVGKSAPIDGNFGEATKRAKQEYDAAETERRKLAIQEGQIKQAGEKNTADTAHEENERIRLENEENARLANLERRQRGEAALKESDKNLSTYDKLMRAYGPTIGGVVGVTTGIGARAGIKKLGDMYQASQAAKAEKLFAGTSGAVTKENLADRVGKTNSWWRTGGAKNEPFVSTPGRAPGVAVNTDSKGMPIGTPIKNLFTPNFLQTKGADLAGMSLPAAKGAFAETHLPEAQAAFEKAKKDVDSEPSDVNIEAYQTAKSRLSGLEAVRMAAVMGGVSYPAYALAKPRYPIKPSTDVAETQKLGIENFLREGETAAQKAAKAAATRQANAARKAGEAATVKAEPGKPLPANRLRRFDNQGNPINRGRKGEIPPTGETPELPMQAAGGRIHANPYDRGGAAMLGVPDQQMEDWDSPNFQSRRSIERLHDWGNFVEPQNYTGSRWPDSMEGKPVTGTGDFGGRFGEYEAVNDAIKPLNSQTPYLQNTSRGDSSADDGSPETTSPRRGKDLIDNPWMGLVQAGLGTMAAAGTRDARGLPISPLAAIGQGGMKGLAELREQQKAGIKQQSIEQAAKRLDRQAEFHRDQFKANEAHHSAQLAEQKRQHDFQQTKPFLGPVDERGVQPMFQYDPKSGRYVPFASPAPKTGAPAATASAEDDGVIPANAKLAQGPAYDYSTDAPHIEKGFDLPPPQPVAGKSASALQTDAEYYLQTGKLPPVRSGRSPVSIAQQHYRDAVQNYGNATAQSRGVTPEQTAEMWRTAPLMGRFILGPDGRSTVALGTAVRHLDTLRELSDAWKAGDNQTVNRLRAVLSREFGGQAVTNLETAGRIVGPEIIKALGVAGAGTSEERSAAAKGFGPTATTDQILGSIDTTQKLLGGQLEGRKRQAANAGVSEERFKSLIGERPYQVLTEIDSGKTRGGSGPKVGDRKQFKQGTGVWDGTKYVKE